MNVVLFDSGRLPLWLRVPALAFGIGLLLLAVELAAYGLLGIRLALSHDNDRGSPLLGSLGSFVVAAVWIFVWFAQQRILFDTTRQELVIWTRGYLRAHKRRVSLVGCRAFYLRYLKGGFAGSSGWRLFAEFADGHTERVVHITSGADALAESLQSATKLPVNKDENVL